MRSNEQIALWVRVGAASARAALFTAAAAVAVVALAAGPVSSANASEGCVNEGIRLEQSTWLKEESPFLPDCRAYELVSAAEAVPKFAAVLEDGVAKGGLAIANARASLGGERLSFASYYPPRGSTQANGFYVASRGEDGWTTESVIPSLSTSARTGCSAAMLFSPELSSAVLTDGQYQTAAPYCGHNEPSLINEEPVGWRDERELEFQNIFLRESFQGQPSYRLVNRTPTAVTPSDAHLQDAAQDLGHVVFSEDAKLTPQAPASGEALYEWVNGTVRLVSVLPDGDGVAGNIVDGDGGGHVISAATYMHAMSNDGSRIFFTAEGKLFVRENAEQEQSELINGDECTEPTKACTTQIDSSQAGGNGGGGTFLAATDDGASVFFMDEATAKLTSDTVAGSKQNLYEYEVASGRLTDLTAVSNADLVGVSGFAEAEGSGSSYLYFVADGAFAAGAVQGQANLYVTHDGEPPEFVATLEASRDSSDWNAEELSVRTSPDGRFVAFVFARTQQTANFPTGYDNAGDEEIYLYDAESRVLNCVSCQPSGAPPQAGGATLLAPSSDALIAEPGAGYLQRNVLDDGTVFFQTQEALVSQDENEATDVYEYSGGELHLLSSGASSESSLFMDASESGEDVFIATTQPLVKRDTDAALSVYDVRVDGGFPEPPEVRECKEEECRGVPPMGQPLMVPGSVSFTGPGNIPPPAEKRAPEQKPALSRHQKLALALKACRKKTMKRRRTCEASAHKKFGRKIKKRSRGGRR